MSKKKLILLILGILISGVGFSQENKINVKLSGFVKNDFFFDTRQTVAAREGHFLLWPSAVNEDDDGNDINSNANFNFLAVQSRIALNISGTEAWGAKLSGKIEGDFFAQANDNINLFRMRHAFVKLNWTNTELLFGQYWNPLLITDCFPGTVSFNTGVPIQPFGRSPQVRLTYKTGGLKLIAVASSERDYASRGSLGATSSYLRNSGTPEINAQIHFAKEKKFIAGVGGGFKSIMPEIETAAGYSTKETVKSFQAIAFMKIASPKITVKLEGIFAQNNANNLMLGGYAVTHIIDDTKGFVEYSPTSTMAFWTDIHTNGKKTQFGIFAGYTENLGSAETTIGNPVGLGTNIKSLYRISPRILFNSGNFRLAFEGEYTVANYGSDFNANALPIDLTAANNFRLLAAVYYFFK